MHIVVAVESDGKVTWEESMPALDPQGPAPIDMDAAVPIHVMKPSSFDRAPRTLVARRKAA